MNTKNLQTKIITDCTLMETIQHGSGDYPFRFYDEHMFEYDFNCIEWHWHTEFEFVFVQTDYIWANIGSEQIKINKGQGIFINSKVLHRFSSTVDAEIPNFLCHPTFISPADSLIYNKYVAPLLASDCQYQIFVSQIPWQNQILAMMKKIMDIQEKPGNELKTSALVQMLWDKLYFNIKDNVRHRNCIPESHVQGRLQMIMSYMHANYMNDITLETLTAQFHISKTALLTLFKEHLQISPINYLIQYRLNQATKLLLNSEKKLAPIALETGFHNVDYFCRSFKRKYNITPSEYRNRKRR